MKPKLPLRTKVEVIILKANKLCIAKQYSADKKKYWYTFPGGGVEEGDTLLQTAEKECLEEVGVQIKNAKLLGLNKVFENPPMKDDRKAEYSGVDVHYVVADYDKLDIRLFNTEGDGLIKLWVSREEAIASFLGNGEFGDLRIKALEKLDTFEKPTKNKVIFKGW